MSAADAGLQTCATGEKAISASVLTSSPPRRLSKRSAGTCPPPLGKEIISQLSCLLRFIVSSLPRRRDEQSGYFLSEGPRAADRVGCRAWVCRRRTQVANLRYRRENLSTASCLSKSGRWHHLAEGHEMVSAALAHASCHRGAILARYSSSTTAAYSGQTAISASSRASFMLS